MVYFFILVAGLLLDMGVIELAERDRQCLFVLAAHDLESAVHDPREVEPPRQSNGWLAWTIGIFLILFGFIVVGGFLSKWVPFLLRKWRRKWNPKGPNPS